MSASTQTSRNDASVRAMRENATCAPENAAKAAATPPGPAAESAAREPGDRRNGERAGDDRDQDRGQVAGTEHEIR